MAVFEETVRQLNERIDRIESQHGGPIQTGSSPRETLGAGLALGDPSGRKPTPQNTGNATHMDPAKGVVKKPPPLQQSSDLAQVFSEGELAMMVKGVEALKEWTRTTIAAVVYDSAKGPFTTDGLFAKIRDRPNIAITAFTKEGDVFGGFYSVAASTQGVLVFDPCIFLFSFESNGRCETPKKFALKEEKRKKSFVKFFGKSICGWFVRFDGGGGSVYLGNTESKTWCEGLSNAFEDIQDTTLTGKTQEKNLHCCTRLVAFELA